MPNGIDNSKEHAAYHIPIGEREPQIEKLSYEELESIYGKEEVDSTPIYYQTVADLEYKPRPQVDITRESGILLGYAESLSSVRNKYIEQGELKLASPDAPIFNNLALKLFGEKVKSRLIDPLFGIYQPIETRDLINRESLVGGKVFGVERPNEVIRFYNLDLNNWYFYQQITDKSNKSQSATIHYEVHPGVVWRSNLGSETLFEPLADDELEVFMLATEMYYKRVMDQVYGKSI